MDAMRFHVMCTCYTGESTSEVKIEADSNDITENPQDDNPTIKGFYGKYFLYLIFI